MSRRRVSDEGTTKYGGPHGRRLPTHPLAHSHPRFPPFSAPLVLAVQGIVRSTTKYWVRMSDVSTVKHHILQHLPVYQSSQGEYSGDAQLVNSGGWVATGWAGQCYATLGLCVRYTLKP